MRSILLALLLAMLTLCAGCAEPGGTDDGGEVTDTETVTDNEFGAEPNNPPEDTTPTVIETTVTANATDGVGVDDGADDEETPTEPETSVTANATVTEAATA